MFLIVYPSPSAQVAQAAVVVHEHSSAPLSETATLQNELAASRTYAVSLDGRLQRANRIIAFSTRYDISAGMSSEVYDAAIAENIDPELAFRLVKLESDFNPHAVSPAGALGLTQLMPATARFYLKHLQDDQLFEPDVNLHIGFRYLHSLVEQYHGQVNMALLVYNRGEVAVRAAKEAGRSPTNGYARILMKGYKGRGVID